jgi:hypothetical protein
LTGPAPAFPNALLSTTPFSLSYNRYEQVGVDAATALGPVQFGAELAYMFGRTFVSSYIPGSYANPTPSELLGQPDRTDVAHAGLRAEFAGSSDWTAVVELSAERASLLPTDLRRQYAFTADGRWLLSSVGFVAYSPGQLGLSIELGAALLNGPTYLLSPRVEQRVFDGFFAEAGAYIMGGKHRPLYDPRITLGGVYDNIDQVFIGVRWLP